MRHFREVIPIWFVIVIVVLPSDGTAAQSTLRLLYDEPASKWTEAMPLGNGRLGAMVFGAAATERLQLNEESLWAGEPNDVYPDNFSQNIRTLQELVLEGRISKARELGLEKLTKTACWTRSPGRGWP